MITEQSDARNFFAPPHPSACARVYFAPLNSGNLITGQQSDWCGLRPGWAIAEDDCCTGPVGATSTVPVVPSLMYGPPYGRRLNSCILLINSVGWAAGRAEWRRRCKIGTRGQRGRLSSGWRRTWRRRKRRSWKLGTGTRRVIACGPSRAAQLGTGAAASSSPSAL